MDQWIQRHIDTNFSDFKGLSITGRIPLKDQLVNEALGELLRSMTTGAVPPKTGSGIDFRSLIKLVKKAEVHSTEGAIVIDIEISV